MIRLTADKNNLKVNNTELLTSGSLNVYFLQFILSDDWKDLRRIACFRLQGNIPSVSEDEEAPLTAVDIELEDDLLCVLPFAMTRFAGLTVQVGIYGIEPDTCQIILPTMWTTIGNVKQGVIPSQREDNPPSGCPGEGGVTESQVKAIIAKYMTDNPVQYTDVVGHPEPLTNMQLKELLK